MIKIRPQKINDTDYMCLMPIRTIFQLYRGQFLLVGETGISSENHGSTYNTNHWQTLPYNVVLSRLLHRWEENSQLQIGSDYIGRSTSNFHNTTTSPTPKVQRTS